MSDREQIAQVPQDKWANVSNSLKSLRGNEQMSVSLKKIWPKKSNFLFFTVVCFLYNFFFILKMSESLISSLLVSDVSELLRSLTKNEQAWAIPSGRSEERNDR